MTGNRQTQIRRHAAAGPEMAELRAYAGRRLDLGDAVRAALHLARRMKDERAENQARALLARLATDRFQLAVAGQFSRGKTTLMNALLGGAYLPMGALPMTSVITVVRYGSRPRAIVRRRAAGLGVEIPVTEVAGYVAQASAKRAEQQVLSVEVEIPAEILRLGFEFVDTPGVGSAIETSTATTRRFLPQADAVIFVTGFDSPLTAPETEFLAGAVRQAGKLFLVVNKRDLVSGQDIVDILAFVRCRLCEDLGIGEPRLFALSALQALNAVPGDGRLASSGVPELHAALREFLTSGKTRLFLRNIAARGASLAATQRRDLLAGRLAVRDGRDPRQALTAFEARIAELDRQRRDLVSGITGRIAAVLPGLLSARAAAWRADLRELLRSSAGAAIVETLPGGSTGDLKETIRDYLERAGRELTGDWLERRTGEVLEMVINLVASQVSDLLQFAQAPSAAAAELAGLATGHDGYDLAGWSPEDLPSLVVGEPKWAAPSGRPARSRRKAAPGDAQMRDQVNTGLADAADTFANNLLAAFRRAAHEWAIRLDEQVVRQMRQSADWFRTCLQKVPADEDLAAADALVARFAALVAALEDPELTAPEGAVSAPAEPPIAGASGVAAGDCVVCGQLQDTLTSYLFTGQLWLSTREDEQEQHALGGGFCSLHTWQYEAVASPLGVASAYAKLAASVADALDALSGTGVPAADLSRRIAAMTAGYGRCPVCAALADRERLAVAEIGTCPAPETAALCLRHLMLVLAAGSDARTAQALLRSLAATLRRGSEDMRAFALKREGYQSRLVTEEESRAYLDVLRRLAGLPTLSRPWTDQESAGM
jgi:hypothetical protein